MKEIKSVQLGFENLESINIPVEHFESIYLSDIVKLEYKHWKSTSLREVEVAHCVVLILSPEADVPFEDDWNKTGSVFNRLTKFSDLTSVNLHFEDGSVSVRETHWCQEDEYSNSYQTSAITNHGELIVVVAEDKTADETRKEIRR